MPQSDDGRQIFQRQFTAIFQLKKLYVVAETSFLAALNICISKQKKSSIAITGNKKSTLDFFQIDVITGNGWPWRNSDGGLLLQNPKFYS